MIPQFLNSALILSVAASFVSLEDTLAGSSAKDPALAKGTSLSDKLSARVSGQPTSEKHQVAPHSAAVKGGRAKYCRSAVL